MVPIIQCASDDRNPFFESLLNVISTVQCGEYFSSHIGLDQIRQKQLVNRFQEKLLSTLKEEYKDFSWEKEYAPVRSQKDAIDIYGSSNNLSVLLELDKHRADQVAKSLFPD